MSDYHISENGLKLIEHFEGFRATQYRDAAGVPTIGYGTTAGARVVNPLPETCTETEAERWLELYVARDVIPAVEAAAAAGKRTFNQNQVDACCSLGYNLGEGIFSAAHTIGLHIRNHKYTHRRIGNDFLLYEYADGRKLAGLVTRREAERALFDRPIK